MSDNSYFHGSDTYQGHCPKCGRKTHTNHDEECEDCFEGEPALCPDCLEWFQPDQMHGEICNECFEYQETEKMEIIRTHFG